MLLLEEEWVSALYLLLSFYAAVTARENLRQRNTPNKDNMLRLEYLQNIRFLFLNLGVCI